MLTLHRLLSRAAGIVVVSSTLLLSGGPTMAGSFGYQGIRYYGGHRAAGSHFIRPRFGTYNSFYPWRRENYGKRYNHYPNYGNSYLGDAYHIPDNTNSDNAGHDITDLFADTVDTENSDNTTGWLLLANGEVHSALKIFSIQTRNFPDNNILKVGYALATAETGDLHKGVSVMRAALRTDPDSLRYLVLDQDLQGIVKNLIDRYEDDDYHTTLATAARHFMISSLYYLLGDAESAGLILPARDTDKSARNLDRLIRQMRPNG